LPFSCSEIRATHKRFNQPLIRISSLSTSTAPNGILKGSFTNHKPLFTILLLGELPPSQSSDGLHSSQRDTVEMILDSNSSLSCLLYTSKTANEKLLRMY